MRIERARGTRDFLPREMRKRRIMEARMREIAERWGYEEISTPTFELAELFTLKSGDAILKEMYEFEDKGGRHLALRPELTAPVIRMYVNELKMASKPTKVYYIGNCFRYEEPQKARYREFWQFGAEIIGSDSPEAQAEIIALAHAILQSVGITAEVHVGHVGLLRERLRAAKVEEERINTVMRLIDKGEREELIHFMNEIGVEHHVVDELLRLIDVQGEDALQAAQADNLIASASPAFKELEMLLELLTYYNVAYTLNLGIARGLDYYTGMVFEIYEVDGSLGAQNQICGGGSYRLAALFGGDDVPSTGFAFGFDRLAEIFRLDEHAMPRGDVVVVPVRERDQDNREVVKEAIQVASTLREFVRTQVDVMNRSLSAQLSYANAIRASFAVLVGKNELKEGKVTVRDLTTGMQERMSLEDCVGRIRATLR
ncbi:MAG: histidine--tRNA ligase [Methanophagales archaeon ANME-1-THS]|nr:MAG: histidine--tRNA ligase [Methanophagales archaeon ANME-1-THS]